MKKRFVKLSAAVLCTAAFASSAMAQFAKPDDAIEYRQGAFTIMAAHFSRVAAMANGRVAFDAKAAADNAAVVEFVSKLPWAAFGEGTDKGHHTKAKPEVWSEPGKFKEAAEKMQVEVSKLAAATKTGNLDAIKTAVGATGASCKACHDSFRSK